MLRGGSWSGRLEDLRSADRDRVDTGNRNNNGFRVARTLDCRSRRAYGTVQTHT